MYNRLKCKRVQRIHVQKYVAPTQAVCFYQKQSYLSYNILFSVVDPDPDPGSGIRIHVFLQGFRSAKDPQ